MALGILTVKDGSGNTQTLVVDVQQSQALVPLHGRNPTPLTDTGSVTCNATAGGPPVQVVPYSAARRWLAVFNRSAGAEIVDLGVSSSVAASGGIPVEPGGGGYVFDGPGAAGPIYAYSPVAGTPLSYAEA